METEKPPTSPCCHSPEQNEKAGVLRSVDWLLWIGTSTVLAGSIYALLIPELSNQTWWLPTFTSSILELISKMWIGLVFAVIFVGLLGYIPRDLVTQILGKGGTLGGIFRATLAGVLLDLCSHGILMVGAKLYERGASIGQVMAFLIASPWNSLSLTIIMITLMGLGWTLTFILFSVLIAVISGLIFDFLVKKKTLPENPSKKEQSGQQDSVKKQFKDLFRQASFAPKSILRLLWTGLKDSRMVFRWILFGILLASLIRTFMPLETYQQLFGPTLAGLFLTLIAATIIEVCSEGSTPLAADLLTRAGAPGNSFTFLMAGVSTDYTEIMVMRDTTKTWRIPLFLPLITLPQILILSWLLNQL